MEKLSVSDLKNSLETKLIGDEILIFRSVSSTQDVARKLLEQGGAEGTVVLAETQTGGRGRFGKDWVSPEGVGIWASIILHPAPYLREGDGVIPFSLACSVAVANAIRKVTGLKSSIKWPNDVLLNRKKVAGILVEISGGSIIVGVGINVNQERFPGSLEDSATSLMMESGGEVSRISVIREVLHQLECYYALLMEKGFAPVIDEMRNLSAVFGKQVVVSSNGKRYAGEAVDLDTDGALLIRLDSGIRVRVVTGSVRIL